jgi:hypothetical protein
VPRTARTVLLIAAGAVLAAAAMPASAAPLTAAAPVAAAPATTWVAAAATSAPRPFLTAVTDRASATAWSTFRLVGKLSPARAGERVVVQRRLGAGLWSAFNAVAHTRADGTYSCPMVSGRRGVNQFRTVRFAAGGQPTVVSNATVITIR